MLVTETRTHRPFGWRLLAALPLTLTLAACDDGDEQAEELALLAEQAGIPPIDELEIDPPESAATAALDDLAAALPEGTAAHVMSHYTWQQGQPATPMATNADHFCFLTGVSGDLSGNSESAIIYQVSGKWWLWGQSSKTGLSARGTCIPKADFGANAVITGEWPWGPSTGPRDIGPANDRVCLLTRVGGNFTGPSERVETYVANGRWYIGGSSQQPSVYATARCITGSPSKASASWSAGQAPAPAANLELACGLSRMQGRFKGAQDRVDVTLDDDQWYVDGSDTPGRSAAAHCM